jgi:acyl carrier protein phosphodiesterase
LNYLAHIYLSGDSVDIMIGNFIGDFVKGKKYLGYPENIGKGIILHRKIDSFTDRHQMTKACKEYLKLKYNMYSGIVVDIFYDHFLATNWKLYSSVPLKDFVVQKYTVLSAYEYFFPEEVKMFFPYFLGTNWLYAYSTFDGLGTVLQNMSSRTSLPDFSTYAIKVLKENYDQLGKNFFTFFSDMISYVEKEYSIKFS